MTDSSDRLKGRVALVTGAGNGIGQACAESLARHGASVVVNDLGTDEFANGRTSEAADSTVAAIRDAGGTATANYDSVAEAAGCDAAVQTAIDTYGKLDIVVGCAGAILDGTLAADDETYQRFMALFLHQKFWLTRAALPGMLERGWGRIITTTSHGATGLLGQPTFAAAMGGVISMTRAIAHDNLGKGVTANCLSPGGATRLHAVTRPMFEQMLADGVVDEEFWAGYNKTPPPEYVAPIVTWLCTDAAKDVTGEVFHARGGAIGAWNRYAVERTIYRGDHETNPPWSLEDLDLNVPNALLAEP